MNHHDHPIQSGNVPFLQVVLGLLLLLVILAYILAAVRSGTRYKKWPVYRTFSWCIGVICGAASIMGPIAEKAHTDFTMHMLGHLLLGMLAPLLLVLSAPITLLLRTLNVNTARCVSRLLRSRIAHFISSPIMAAILNIGGLWVLYTTSLFAAMHMIFIIYLLVHLHLFLAGYLFTAAMIYIDPVAHRFSFAHRAAVLVLSLAGHGILSKWIYAHPPDGVPAAQAELGGMLMYYGGDAIELGIVIILCAQWYKAAWHRESLSLSH